VTEFVFEIAFTRGPAEARLREGKVRATGKTLSSDGVTEKAQKV